MLKFTAILIAGLLVLLDGVLSLPTGSDTDAVLVARNPAVPVICSVDSRNNQDCGFENPTLSPWFASPHFGEAKFSLVKNSTLANSGSNSVVFVGEGQAALSTPALSLSNGSHQVTFYTRLAAGQPCALGVSYGDEPISEGEISPVSQAYSATTIHFNVRRIGSLEFTITCFGDAGSTVYMDDVTVV